MRPAALQTVYVGMARGREPAPGEMDSDRDSSVDRSDAVWVVHGSAFKLPGRASAET